MISFLAADIDPSERSRSPLKSSRRQTLGQHDLGVGLTRPQEDGLFEPFLGVVKPVRQQGDASQLKDSRIVPRILSGDT